MNEEALLAKKCTMPDISYVEPILFKGVISICLLSVFLLSQRAFEKSVFINSGAIALTLTQ